ncbi:MAG: hypothetical protein KDB61_09655, partial [Planctomycetes bacterium]|nr:hypothetical protein [Planctomycetota bacterium]
MGTSGASDGAVDEEGDLVGQAEAVESRPSMLVRARVVDWNHAPVREREITIWYEQIDPMPQRRRFFEEDIARYQVTSDGDGMLQANFVFPETAPEEIGIVLLDAERQAYGQVARARVIVDGRGDLGTLQIYAASEKYPNPRAEGRVLDEFDQPVNGVSGSFIAAAMIQDFEVSVSASDASEIPIKEPGDRGEFGQITIDANGYFKAYGPESWPAANITFQAPGFVEAAPQVLHLPATTARFTLYRALDFSGRLLLPEGSPPIGEFRVDARQSARSTSLTPDSKGFFHGVISSQSLEVRVRHGQLRDPLWSLQTDRVGDDGLELGEVNLTQDCQVLKLILTDMHGVPLANDSILFRDSATGRWSPKIKLNEEGVLHMLV